MARTSKAEILAEIKQIKSRLQKSTFEIKVRSCEILIFKSLEKESNRKGDRKTQSVATWKRIDLQGLVSRGHARNQKLLLELQELNEKMQRQHYANKKVA